MTFSEYLAATDAYSQAHGADKAEEALTWDEYEELKEMFPDA